MSGFSLGTILKAAFIAGLAAGLTAAVFHLIVTEPLIDQAIELEEQHLAAEGEGEEEAAGEHEAPIVSREVQKGGLVLGLLMYALVWSALVGVIYHLAQQWLPGEDERRKRLLLVLAAYWSVALFPFLKYPANPPGVGGPGDDRVSASAVPGRVGALARGYCRGDCSGPLGGWRSRPSLGWPAWDSWRSSA